MAFPLAFVHLDMEPLGRSLPSRLPNNLCTRRDTSSDVAATDGIVNDERWPVLAVSTLYDASEAGKCIRLPKVHVQSISIFSTSILSRWASRLGCLRVLACPSDDLKDLTSGEVSHARSLEEAGG